MVMIMMRIRGDSELPLKVKYKGEKQPTVFYSLYLYFCSFRSIVLVEEEM